MIYYRWVDENGDLVTDEDGNYILLTVRLKKTSLAIDLLLDMM